jgi:hypothetical protein
MYPKYKYVDFQTTYNDNLDLRIASHVYEDVPCYPLLFQIFH